MTNIKEIISLIPINLSNITFKTGSFISLEYQFPIMPKTFLNFAKQDFAENSERGTMNALTNLKRAIDCQIDLALKAIGINLSKNKIKEYMLALGSKEKLEASDKVRLIQALGIAPPYVISKLRKIRNKLEHDYEMPDPEDIRDGIEIGEMFIGTVQNKLSSFVYEFIMGEKDSIQKSDSTFNTCIHLTHWQEPNSESHFQLRFFSSGKNILNHKITCKDSCYLHFIKLCLSLETDVDLVISTYYDLLSSIGCEISKDKIAVAITY